MTALDVNLFPLEGTRWGRWMMFLALFYVSRSRRTLQRRYEFKRLYCFAGILSAKQVPLDYP